MSGQGQSRGAPAKRKKEPRMVQTTLHRFQKTPEQIVEERHAPGYAHPQLSKEQKEEAEEMRELIAYFCKQCDIPPRVLRSWNFEIVMEAMARCGPGFVFPTADELRGPLFDGQMEKIEKSKRKHDKAWKSHGCTLMIDSRTDHKRALHWINFVVYSVQGTFFLESVDASDQWHDAVMLADLIEKRIVGIGRDKVVQVVTGNNDNLKAACKLIMERMPTLFWTPCAFQSLDLMLDDIAKLTEFRKHIEHAKHITTFIYRHSRLLSATREKIGGNDPVVYAITTSSTTFLNLESLCTHRNALRSLFDNEDWSRSKLSSTEAGKKVCEIVHSTTFWNVVEDCIKASGPLLAVLRMVYRDDSPAMPEVSLGMDLAKKKINESFACKPTILKKLLDIVEKRWADQMEQKLYGAALFLNPNNFFDIKENDHAYASRLRSMFNDVIQKMVSYDADLIAKMSDLADQYESFGKMLPAKIQKAKSPNDWWGAYRGYAGELQKFVRRIVGLGCSAFGSEYYWTIVEKVHTMMKDEIEPKTGFGHKRYKDFVCVRYNLNIESRSRKQRVEGINYDPLIEDSDEENEWTNSDAGIYHFFANRHFEGSSQGSDGEVTDEPDSDSEEDEPFVEDDYHVEDDYGLKDRPTPMSLE